MPDRDRGARPGLFSHPPRRGDDDPAPPGRDDQPPRLPNGPPPGDYAAMQSHAYAADPETTDETARLLVLAAQEDAAAFRQLYDLEAPRLYAVALRITRQPSLASDAVHDAMLQVWRNASRFDPARGNPRAWLISLVRYRALDMIARTRREVAADKLPDLPDPDPDPLDRLLTTSTGEALHRCLKEIDPQRRSWIVLAFLDGLSHMEVAARVSQPLGTIKSGIRRSLIALRSCLGASA